MSANGRTPSDPMETSCCVSVREILKNIQQSGVEEGVENVGKRIPSDPMETGCRGKRPSDSLRVISQET